MAIVLRLPKRPLRVALLGVGVVALGAGVAARADLAERPGASEQAAIAAATVPDDHVIMYATAPRQSPPTSAQESASQQGEGQQGTTPAEQGQQPQGQQQPPAATPTTGATQELLTPEEREALELVERLIREQEGVLMGTGFDYSPGGRRDPFRSLLAEITAVSAPTVRPFGLPGFLIGEIELKAIAAVQGRWHAMVVGPNQRAYFLEVGTEVFDGHVVEIGPSEVIFEQIVPDITGARRTRQVTKRLRTTDGGGETP
jgi:hypothetical protein